MIHRITQRLHGLMERLLSEAEAGHPDAATPATPREGISQLAGLCRVAVILHRLDTLCAATPPEPGPEPGPEPEPEPEPAPEPAPEPEADPAAAAPPPETDTDPDEAPADDVSADDSARMAALRERFTRQLERITGRRESRCRPEGFELIPGGVAGRQLAHAGPPGPTSSGDG